MPRKPSPLPFQSSLAEIVAESRRLREQSEDIRKKLKELDAKVADMQKRAEDRTDESASETRSSRRGD